MDPYLKPLNIIFFCHAHCFWKPYVSNVDCGLFIKCYGWFSILVFFFLKILHYLSFSNWGDHLTSRGQNRLAHFKKLNKILKMPASALHLHLVVHIWSLLEWHCKRHCLIHGCQTQPGLSILQLIDSRDDIWLGFSTIIESHFDVSLLMDYDGKPMIM